MRIPHFSYDDLIASLEILRRRTDTRVLAELIAYAGYLVAEIDLRKMLKYLVRRGKLVRHGRGAQATVRLRGQQLVDALIQQKIQKSAEPWPGQWTSCRSPCGSPSRKTSWKERPSARSPGRATFPWER